MRRRPIYISVLGAFVALTSTAFAADIPPPVYKAPAYPAVAAFGWTGFYIGGHAGYGWSSFDGHSSFGSGSANANGFLGGAQLGYNYQIGSFVLGVEGDYAWADVKHDEPLFAGTLTLKNDYFATVAARIGYAFDRTLLYGKVGGAWTRDKWNGNDGLGGTATGTFSRSGWMLGAGLEYAFAPHWSAKIEYDYLMFGSINENLTTGGGLVVIGGPASIKLNTQIVKAGINYRFDFLN